MKIGLHQVWKLAYLKLAYNNFCVGQLQVWRLKNGLQKLEVGLHHFTCRPTSSLGDKTLAYKKLKLAYIMLSCATLFFTFYWIYSNEKTYLGHDRQNHNLLTKVSRFNALIMPVLVLIRWLCRWIFVSQLQVFVGQFPHPKLEVGIHWNCFRPTSHICRPIFCRPIFNPQSGLTNTKSSEGQLQVFWRPIFIPEKKV